MPTSHAPLACDSFHELGCIDTFFILLLLLLLLPTVLMDRKYAGAGKTERDNRRVTPAEAAAATATAKLLLWSLTPKGKPKSNRKINRYPLCPLPPSLIAKAPNPHPHPQPQPGPGKAIAQKLQTQTAVSACFCMFPPCQPRLPAHFPLTTAFLHMKIVKAPHFTVNRASLSHIFHNFHVVVVAL